MKITKRQLKQLIKQQINEITFHKKIIKESDEDEVNQIVDEFLDEKNELSKKIKMMPINWITEKILSKIRDAAKKNGYLSEPLVYNLLSSKEKDYLYKEF